MTARLVGSKRWILIALGVLGLLAVARVSARERFIPVYAEIERRALEREVPFTGRVRALQVAQYGPPQLGRVWDYRITFLAREGSVVAAGDPVLRFDTTELEQSLRRHLADRDAAASELARRSRDFAAELAEQELALEEATAQERRARVNADIPPELVARTTREKAAVDVELAKSELAHRKDRIADLGRRSRTELGVLRDRRNRAAEAVVEIEESIELMTVRASSGGTVSHRADRRGSKRKVGDSCWRGERVVEIPATDALRIDAWVKESESGTLRVGQPATMWLEAHPERSFRARIEGIQQTVERDSDVEPGPVVRLDLSFEGIASEPIHPGMRVQGKVGLERGPEQLLVRTDAVRAGANGPMVVKKRLLGTVSQPVEVGASNGEWVEIRSGLEPGDRVLIPR